MWEFHICKPGAVRPVIDSVALVWGHALGMAERRVRGVVEPRAAPVRIDLEALGEKLGRDQGEITTKSFGEGEPTPFGHWKTGRVDVMYREGRLEARASLPKLLLGRNDVVLDEGGVHDGLRELVRVTRELVDGCGAAGHPSTPPLTLRGADPARLDYCFQWDVASVGMTIECLRAGFKPSRKLQTMDISPQGGRTLTYGKGGKRLVRFYDKVGEMLAHGDEIPPDVQLDTLLRYEIQDRHRGRVRLVHENGYRAADVRRELTLMVQHMGAMALEDLDAVLDTYGTYPHRIAYTLAAFGLSRHHELEPWLRRHATSSTYYRWRQRAQVVAMSVSGWAPSIPDDAFEDRSSSLWTLEAVA